ncbi:gluconate:H+ symporter [Emticicia sp. 17c]|uniref:gluconate:H+ symporter n=1 Tax=Emticicia sp. 17c TaxID=3127704 RepID=UPI00301D5D7A
MPIILTLIAIIALIVLVAFVKLDTFISFILIAIGLGLASGMEVESIGKSIQKGIGGTLGELILIIGFGAMLGKLVAESGAAQRITDTLIRVFGKKYLQWGLALAGFIIGIPLFYNAGFIIVVPLIFSISISTNMPILYVGIPMLSALSVAHGYLPPHPSPAAIAKELHANVGQTLMYGIIIAIPAIAIAGPIFGRTLKKYKPQIDTTLFNVKPIPKEKQPSLFESLLVALMPVILLMFTSFFKKYYPVPFIFKALSKVFFTDTATITKYYTKLVTLIAEPYVGMLLSLLLAIYLLGIKQGHSIKTVSKQLEEAFKSCSVILLIIAGAGALKQILSDSQISLYIGEQLQGFPMNPLVLGWTIAAVLRLCVGSATVAGLTAVGIVAPLVSGQTGVKPELMVLSIGAGSLLFSHLNDGGFWLFKEYFNLSIKDTIKTWSVMETIVSVVGLLGVLVLNMFI